MRLATAADEILPTKDPRVTACPPYLAMILLSRVITRLGSLEKDQINPKVIESLFVSDLNYLRRLYQKINSDDNSNLKTICPKCENEFNVDIRNLE
jgi:phage FluMu protein gp41